MALAIVVFAALVVFEYMYSWLVLREPRHARVAIYGSNGSIRTSIVLPGFSNPPQHLGEGMRRILGCYGPTLIVHYGTLLCFDEIYCATLNALKQANGPRSLLIYGNSMGGQLGEQFGERYELEGSPYGPIRELLLDCTPGTAISLPAPKWVKAMLRAVLVIYWGGPFLALGVGLSNVIYRITTAVPRSSGADPRLYQRYARGLM